MTFQLAKSILDVNLKNISPQKPIVIEIFGGEAFENFDLIKRLDEYICKEYGQLNVKYETTTNGTLVHGEIKNWLFERRNRFFITLSLDGTKEMHDLNRKFANGEGSFDSIDIKFFAHTWPNCPAKMTVSEKTLPHLAEGVIYLHKLGFQCDATLSVGVQWDQKKNMPILYS